MLAAGKGHRQNVSDQYPVAAPEVRVDDSGNGYDLAARLLNRQRAPVAVQVDRHFLPPVWTHGKGTLAISRPPVNAPSDFDREHPGAKPADVGVGPANKEGGAFTHKIAALLSCASL